MKKLAVLTVLMAVLAAVFWLWPSGSPKELKKTETGSPTPEVRAFMEKLIRAVSEKDQRAFASAMSAPDEVMFREYAAMLFQDGDFAPAALLDMTELKNGSSGSASVRVKSEKRSRIYEFRLIRRKGNFALVSVREAE